MISKVVNLFRPDKSLILPLMLGIFTSANSLKFFRCDKLLRLPLMLDVFRKYKYVKFITDKSLIL